MAGRPKERIVSGADGQDSTKHIYQSLGVNFVIAIAKFGAAFFTGSGAMLAEAIHSFADCGNQVLLLRGVMESRKAPDEEHPLGYGRTAYFWSFMVALLLFSGGGVFSIYEGVHHFLHPEPISNILLAIGILGGSLLLEGWATFGNIRELNKRRGDKPLFRYLRETKDSDLVVVFGENAAAVLGLALALLSVGLVHITGDHRLDALGSFSVGLVLIGVAVFLAREVRSLLVGEAADPSVKKAALELVEASADIERLLACISIQQGPGEVMVAVKLRLKDSLSAREVVDAINAFEVALQQRCPEVKWSFVEPDIDKKAELNISSAAQDIE